MSDEFEAAGQPDDRARSETGNVPEAADAVEGGTHHEGALLLVPSADVVSAPAGAEDGSDSAPLFPRPRLDAAALYGIVGEAVEFLRPCTEAEDANVLVSLLVGLGAMIGPDPYVAVGANKHTAKTMAVIVGDTAKARKGHGWSASRRLLQRVDEPFFATQYVTGLSTGEGLINRLRDSESATCGTDAGRFGPDPRLLIVEQEWAKLLDQDKRQGNTLTAVLRLAWDHEPLEALTRRDPVRAMHHHVGLIGHITYEELAEKLTSTLAANGFANRHLFVFVARHRIVPVLDEPDEARLDALATRLRTAVQRARSRRQTRLDSSAQDLWCDLYRLFNMRRG